MIQTVMHVYVLQLQIMSGGESVTDLGVMSDLNLHFYRIINYFQFCRSRQVKGKVKVIKALTKERETQEI
jgi:hypothetical protein